jgi:hypothetical protein
MPLTKKTMVLFDEEQYKRIADFAKSRHISVGQAIRDAVDTVVLKKSSSEARMNAAVRLTSVADEEIDWEKFERSVIQGHGG